mmetsp:Transcript_1095/g.2062  ORF Transcript_1095/g.2062 Transcript_1095/m.2062 type:complete len:211 (+) Transcript_1095:69-701(+)
MVDTGEIIVGVLELHGDYAEHAAMLKHLGVKTRGVRSEEDLNGIHALVIPGGESTVMAKLLVEWGMMKKVKELGALGLPMFGTCAGCIMLAKDLDDYPNQPRIGVINMTVRRNAYGAQIDSFETDVKGDSSIFKPDQPLHAIHIRAPQILEWDPKSVEILASYDSKPVLVRQGNLLATTFHPEITKDTRIHQLFINIVKEYYTNQLISKT